MTHEHVMERLDDWAGGDLPPAERAGVELHLAGCAECRAEAEALQALLAEVGALPAEILPGRDLWAGIAARLEAPAESSAPAPARRGRLPVWMLQAAAAVLLVAGTATLTRFLSRPAEPAGGGVAAAELPPSKPAESAFVAFQRAEGDYEDAIGDLETVLQTRRERLAPETVQTLERNLAIIDEAIEQSRQALARDPDSAQLTRMLAAAYAQKLGVLQQAVQL